MLANCFCVLKKIRSTTRTSLKQFEALVANGSSSGCCSVKSGKVSLTLHSTKLYTLPYQNSYLFTRWTIISIVKRRRTSKPAIYNFNFQLLCTLIYLFIFAWSQWPLSGFILKAVCYLNHKRIVEVKYTFWSGLVID